MDQKHPVYTCEADCQDCCKCIRSCPVKAIRIEDSHAIVMPEYCISCGQCVLTCPSGAKQVRNDRQKVEDLLAQNEEIVVSLAPSYISEFDDYTSAQLVAAIKKLGFAKVSETALGAEIVSHSVAKLVKEKPDQKLFISSACPTAVEYLSKYCPEKAKYITSLLSPLLSHCRLLKNLYGEKTKVVFFGPCIAKKTEADTHTDLLEAALTFEDLHNMLDEKKIKPEDIVVETENKESPSGFEPVHSGPGALYPVDGGMLEGIMKGCTVVDASFLSFSGLDNLKSALDDINPAELKKPMIVELLACNGGCINGPLIRKRSGTALKRVSVINSAKSQDIDPELYKDLDINEDLTSDSVDQHKFTDSQLTKILQSVGKYHQDDELNCGGCGYENCREFAAALLDNKAEKNMCVSYMRQLAHNKANFLIKAMPSGVVIVDKQLRIVEANRPFAKLMGPDTEAIFDARPGMHGASLERVAPFVQQFKHVLETGNDILDKDVRIGNRILHASFFPIEENELAGGIMQDITEPSVNKEHVIRKAQEVVAKNLATVQTIAGLLGENAAETQITLDSIIKSFTPFIEDEDSDSGKQ